MKYSLRHSLYLGKEFNLGGVIYFKQRDTLWMFLAGFSDVTNHVSKMKNSEVSLLFSAVVICRPVTDVAWIGKKIL